jgi:hypothetical protein
MRRTFANWERQGGGIEVAIGPAMALRLSFSSYRAVNRKLGWQGLERFAKPLCGTSQRRWLSSLGSDIVSASLCWPLTVQRLRASPRELDRGSGTIIINSILSPLSRNVFGFLPRYGFPKLAHHLSGWFTGRRSNESRQGRKNDFGVVRRMPFADHA